MLNKIYSYLHWNKIYIKPFDKTCKFAITFCKSVKFILFPSHNGR